MAAQPAVQTNRKIIAPKSSLQESFSPMLVHKMRVKHNSARLFAEKQAILCRFQNLALILLTFR